MRYAIVIEKADDSYSAYIPDLPGCVDTGSSIVEVEEQIREVIEFTLMVSARMAQRALSLRVE